MATKPIYMICRGYEVIAEGTSTEVARMIGKSPSYIRYLASDLHHKRINSENALFAYRIEEDEMARSRTPLVKPLAPSTRDWSKQNKHVEKIERPQQVWPEPNKKATDAYLEMMFGGWR